MLVRNLHDKHRIRKVQRMDLGVQRLDLATVAFLGKDLIGKKGRKKKEREKTRGKKKVPKNQIPLVQRIYLAVVQNKHPSS